MAVPEGPRRRPARRPAADANGADAEQRHVLHDFLAAEQPELPAGENLGSVLEPDRQVDLAHVDLGARLRTVAEVVVNAGVLDLRREPEVDAEVHAGFLAARLKGGEGGKEPGPNTAVGAVARSRVPLREIGRA